MRTSFARDCPRSWSSPIGKQRTQLKAEVTRLLSSGDLDDGLCRLDGLPTRGAVNVLLGLLCSEEEALRWRAISALGRVVAGLAEVDTDAARTTVRRLMWTLNDESGGIGWGAPEAMAEIMARRNTLAEEYANILVSYLDPRGNDLEYVPLRAGVVWGIGRLAEARPDLLRGAVPFLLPMLESDEAPLRGLAAWAVGRLKAMDARSHLQALVDDDAEIRLWTGRGIVTRTVGRLAREALAGLDA